MRDNKADIGEPYHNIVCDHIEKGPGRICRIFEKRGNLARNNIFRSLACPVRVDKDPSA